ncbi:unnamed protein product, partial [Staurois parvus]
QRSVIHHSTEHVSTALESSYSLLYTTASHTLLCTWRCKPWMQLLSHGGHSMKLSMHCCCANLKATRSLEFFSE